MSTGKMRRDEAAQVIDQIKPLLAGPAEFYVAGSYRRGKAWVGDLEIVALAEDPRGVLARLDSLVVEGQIERALYGQPGRYTQRWGDKYRGFCLPGEALTIEVFMATPDNFGFIWWLRTGPGEANTAIMRWLHGTPLRFDGGYAVERQTGRRIRTATETQVFDLLGMDWVAPDVRSLDVYQARFDPAEVMTRSYTLVDRAVPGQLSLF